MDEDILMKQNKKKCKKVVTSQLNILIFYFDKNKNIRYLNSAKKSRHFEKIINNIKVSLKSYLICMY